MSKAGECGASRCPPCMMLEGQTAITVQNCNASSHTDYFFANINNDGYTVAVISDGFQEEGGELAVSRTLLAGESVYCQCSAGNRLSCPLFSSCTYSVNERQNCNAFMPGCRVTYQDQSGPSVNHQIWALQYLAPRPMDPNSTTITM